MTEEQPRSLRTGNYVIDLSDGPSVVSRVEEKSGHKENRRDHELKPSARFRRL